MCSLKLQQGRTVLGENIQVRRSHVEKMEKNQQEACGQRYWQNLQIMSQQQSECRMSLGSESLAHWGNKSHTAAVCHHVTSPTPHQTVWTVNYNWFVWHGIKASGMLHWIRELPAVIQISHSLNYALGAQSNNYKMRLRAEIDQLQLLKWEYVSLFYNGIGFKVGFRIRSPQWWVKHVRPTLCFVTMRCRLWQLARVSCKMLFNAVLDMHQSSMWC